MSAPSNVPWRKLATWALAVVACAFVVFVVPFRDRCSGTGPCEPGLFSTLAHARPEFLFGSLALYFGGTLAWAVRWRALLSLAKLELPVSFVWRTTIEAQAGGILLPGGVAGDALRVAAMVGRGAPTGTVVATAILDRLIGLATLAGVAGLLGISVHGDLSTTRLDQVAWGLAAVPVGLLSFLFLLRSPRVADRLARGRIGRLLREPLLYLADPAAPSAMGRAAIASLFVSGAQLVVIHGLVIALFGTPTDVRWIYVGAAMSFMVAAFPALPGGWGTSDAAFVFFLHFAGLSAPLSLAVCLIYRAFWYLSGVVGAISRVVGTPGR